MHGTLALSYPPQSAYLSLEPSTSLPGNSPSKPSDCRTKLKANLRRVGHIGRPRESHVGFWFRRLPAPDADLEQLVLRGRLVYHVADPGVPARVDLGRVDLVFLVVHPPCPQRQLLRQVLVVLVPEPVRSDQRAGFGVALL